MEAPRLFTCAHCGHNLRLGTARCSVCWQPTPLKNRKIVWLGGAFAIVVLISLMM